VAARRLLVIAGLAAAALLAFAVLAAALRRRDVGAELERLRAAGARRGQLVAFLALEAGALAGAGVLAGALLALAGTALAGAAVAGDAGVLLGEALLRPPRCSPRPASRSPPRSCSWERSPRARSGAAGGSTWPRRAR
jgi:hypothetical protein